MSHYQTAAYSIEDEAEAAHALVRLRGVLALVERMAGGTDAAAQEAAWIDQQALDDGAALALGYASAPSIARRRFDALAAEAAGFAAAGLSALIQHKQRTGGECATAARELADEMRRSIDAMERIIAATPRR
jgi:hypothetical protein